MGSGRFLGPPWSHLCSFSASFWCIFRPFRVRFLSFRVLSFRLVRMRESAANFCHEDPGQCSREWSCGCLGNCSENTWQNVRHSSRKHAVGRRLGKLFGECFANTLENVRETAWRKTTGTCPSKTSLIGLLWFLGVACNVDHMI